MMGQTLYDKLWDSHLVHAEEDGTSLVYIDRHLVHEVTSPQAFEGLKLAGRNLAHVVRGPYRGNNTPTTGWERGIAGSSTRPPASRWRRSRPTARLLPA